MHNEKGLAAVRFKRGMRTLSDAYSWWQKAIKDDEAAVKSTKPVNQKKSNAVELTSILQLLFLPSGPSRMFSEPFKTHLLTLSSTPPEARPWLPMIAAPGGLRAAGERAGSAAPEEVGAGLPGSPGVRLKRARRGHKQAGCSESAPASSLVRHQTGMPFGGSDGTIHSSLVEAGVRPEANTIQRSEVL